MKTINFEATREHDRLYRPAMDAASSMAAANVENFNIGNWLKDWEEPQGMDKTFLDRKKIERILHANIVWETVCLGHDGKDTIEAKVPKYIDPRLLGGKLLEGIYEGVYITLDRSIRAGYKTENDARGLYVTHLEWIYTEEVEQNYLIYKGENYLSVDGKYYQVRAWENLPSCFRVDLL